MQLAYENTFKNLNIDMITSNILATELTPAVEC